MRSPRLRVALLSCGALLVAACAGPKRPPPPSTDVDEEGFREQVRILASDAFEGRKPGTGGEEKTVSYLVAQFRRFGLKPANGDSYLQSVPMVESVPGGDAALTVAGRDATRALVYARDMVIWTKRVAPEAGLRRSELVFAGYGIVAPEYGWNDYADIDVRGRTVVLLAGDPGLAGHDPTVFKGRTMTTYGRWAYKFEEAARHGAAGVLLVHDAGTAGYGWDAVVHGWTGPQLDRPAQDDNAGRAAIEGWLSGDAARGLFAMAGLDFGAVTRAAALPGFKAVPMGLTADAEVHNSIRRFNSSNVIGILPGHRRRRDVILYTAHWDHLGRATGLAGDAIYHGAVDNASGVAGLLMLARSFGRTVPAPDRSIVFLALTGGESGLLGSAYYVDNPIFPLNDTVAVLSLDVPHIGGPTRDVTVFGMGQSELDGYLRDAAALQGRELHPDPNPEQGVYFRSDQFSFARAGVPGVYAIGGIDDSARGPVWGRAQLDDYYAHRYRQAGDEYSPAWDVRGTLDDLRLYYALGMRLAQTRRFPKWYPNSDFRAIRERSRDGAE